MAQCEILLHRNANSYGHSNVDKDKRGVYKEGYPVVAKNLPHPGWGKKEVFAGGKFVIIRITDSDVAGIDEYMKAWEMEIELTETNHDMANDIITFTASNSKKGKTAYSQLSEEKMKVKENDVKLKSKKDKLDATNKKIDNEVDVELDVYEFLTSESFWQKDFGAIFSLVGYEPISGTYEVNMDLTGYTVDEVLKQINFVTRKGASDARNNMGVLNFTISRSVIVADFSHKLKRFVKKENLLYRRRYKLKKSEMTKAVKHCEDNKVEYYEMTKADFISYLEDRLEDNNA